MVVVDWDSESQCSKIQFTASEFIILMRKLHYINKLVFFILFIAFGQNKNFSFVITKHLVRNKTVANATRIYLCFQVQMIFCLFHLSNFCFFSWIYKKIWFLSKEEFFLQSNVSSLDSTMEKKLWWSKLLEARLEVR